MLGRAIRLPFVVGRPAAPLWLPLLRIAAITPGYHMIDHARILESPGARHALIPRENTAGPGTMLPCEDWYHIPHYSSVAHCVVARIVRFFHDLIAAAKDVWYG